MQDYKQLNVWQKAMDFVDMCYDVGRQLPTKEQYGLSSQLQRAAVSVASNIAEGRSRSSDKDFARFLEIALGSTYECETLLLVIQRQYPMSTRDPVNPLTAADEIRKMLFTFHRTLKA